MEMLGAIVLVFALQKIAALLSIPVILGMIWVKGKASRMDGEAWEQYFRQVSNRQYVVFLLVSYGIPLLLLSALGYCLYDFLSLTDPLILEGLTFLFSIGLFISCIVDWANGAVVAGWTTTVASTCLIGGITLLSQGIIGEYIGKIYMESKGRPRYIVDSMILRDAEDSAEEEQENERKD